MSRNGLRCLEFRDGGRKHVTDGRCLFPPPLAAGPLGVLLVTLLLWGAALEAAEPKVVSLSPLGATRGTTVQIQVRGKDLEEVYAITSPSAGLAGKVRRIDPVELGLPQVSVEEESILDRHGRQASIDLTISPTASLGHHRLRLVAPGGVSEAVLFHVVSEPTVSEVATSHAPSGQAQSLGVPTVVHGVLSNPGEVDYYRFAGVAGAAVALELVASRRSIADSFRPQLTLYQRSGSWFDPQRLIRLDFNDGAVIDAVRATTSQEVPTSKITYKFSQDGDYWVAVTSAYGTGSPEYSYQLRLAPIDTLDLLDDVGEGVYFEAPYRLKLAGWNERTFRRKLTEDYLKAMSARTIRADQKPVVKEQLTTETTTANVATSEEETSAAGQPPEVAKEKKIALGRLSEVEPNGSLAEAVLLPFPQLAEGTIEKAGDVDLYKFTAPQDGQVVLEIETPKASPLRFNPRLDVLDTKGKLLFVNVPGLTIDEEGGEQLAEAYTSPKPKIAASLEGGQDYYLRVRAISARSGGCDFAYRLLLRQPIPHLGTIVMDTERFNLLAGSSQQVTVTVDHEEGFNGQLAVTVSNLPDGVIAAFPTGVDGRGEEPTAENAIRQRKMFFPTARQVAITLIASENAPSTKMPSYIEISGHPLVQGRPGPRLAISRVPLMVVRPEKKGAARDTSREEKS